MRRKKLKIGLALGCGGMCGLAHIGFLKALEENGIKVDMISGISMGAVVGGLYASGLSVKELENFALTLKKNEVIELNAFKIVKESLFSGRKIEKYLNKIVKVQNIEDAKIKFYAQAMDIVTGKLHTFENGSLVEAIRASSAIPGIFSPVYKDGICYVDGGVLESVPFKILKERGADVIIAVNCLNEYKLTEIPKSSIAMLIASFDCLQYTVWKYSKEIFKDYYDIYCSDAVEGVSPLSTDVKIIPHLIEKGKEKSETFMADIKKIIEEKTKELNKK